jgi:polyphosphate kinase 2
MKTTKTNDEKARAGAGVVTAATGADAHDDGTKLTKKLRKKLRGKKRGERTAEAVKTNGNGHGGPVAFEAGGAIAATETETNGSNKLTRKKYEKRMRHLQTEICNLQAWVKATGQRVVIVFEGRDAAGKGGMIRALTERVSPRVFRVVALPAPSDRQKTQIYAQRYIENFPAAGEVVIFDRSWYNRAGVERVMGFTTNKAYERFLQMCPRFERVILENGIILVKYWLEVSDAEQARRFEARIKDPMRQWKLSAMDLPSRERWYEYSRARDMMLLATDTDLSPWHIVRSDDKRSARLSLLSHLLSVIPYEPVKRPKVKLPRRSNKHAYDDETPMLGRRWIPDVSV